MKCAMLVCSAKLYMFWKSKNCPICFHVPEFVERVPYNKPYTELQLQAGGGFILEDFNESQVRVGGGRERAACL